MTAPTATSDPLTQASAYVLPLATIAQHPRNPRRHLGDLRELTASIRHQGVLQPLVVAPSPATAQARGVRWLLIAGHRRHAAALAAGLLAVPCVIRQDLTEETAQLKAMLAENLQRADLHPLEEGDAYQELLDLGDTPAVIARDTGRAPRLVRERLKLAAAAESVRELAFTGQVSLDDVLALQSFAGTGEHARLEKTIGTPRFDRDLADARSRRERDKSARSLTRNLKALGAQVINPPQLDDIDAQGRAWTRLHDQPQDPADPDVAALVSGIPPQVSWWRLDAPTGPPTPPFVPRAPKPDPPTVTYTAIEAGWAVGIATDPAEAGTSPDTATELADATTQARRAWLRRTIEEANPDHARHALIAAVLDHVHGSAAAWTVLAHVLDLRSQDPEDLRAAMEGLPLPAMAIALRVASHTLSEHALATGNHWDYGILAWTDALTELGYPLTEVEQQVLAKVPRYNRRS